MKLSVFIRSWLNIFNNALSKFKNFILNKDIKSEFTKLYNRIAIELNLVRHKFKDLRKTNYELGLLHYENDNLSDAIFRFKLLKFFYPDFIELNYLIGRCYIEQNLQAKAKPFIEAYLSHDDKKYSDEAKYCYDLVNARFDNIKSIPLSIVRRSFNLLSTKYNSFYISKPNNPQDTIYQVINTYLTEISTPFGNNILDLGCGTGYIGELLKVNRVGSSITGVDVSGKMINICQNLRTDKIVCYDTLIHEDIGVYLKSSQSAQYNVIVMSNLITYYPNFENIIIKCLGILKSNGCLALSFKTNDGKKDITFDGFFEEFSFNDSYITNIITTIGFKIKNSLEIKFPDGDNGIIMLLIKE